ncbi:MAG: 50S ribosome-binding GTPase [Planctomycetes bacterium]|nr:50S ribosome-binding GTPase [Planctomycetota bacterium]
MPSSNNLRNKAGSSVIADSHYRWLSPPGASALALLFLSGDTSALFGGSLKGLTATPRRLWLADARGEIIDEAMGCRHRGGVLLTLHGGAGVRRAVERAMGEDRAQRDDATGQMFGETCFERATLALLPEVRGAAAVSLALQAAARAPALSDALSSGNLSDALSQAEPCRFLFSPPRVQLWGPVNAGKSSLLNALCGRTLAAAGAEPGLTRDVIEGRIEHQGFEVRLFDAPGTWAGASSRLDDEALGLARHWRAQADLTIALTPPGAQPTDGDWSYHSRVDESGLVGLSIRHAETLTALKDRLVRHFFGGLGAGIFALHPDLRADLQAVLEGRADSNDVRLKWLG